MLLAAPFLKFLSPPFVDVYSNTSIVSRETSKSSGGSVINYSSWFHPQLQTSADSLQWSTLQIPITRRDLTPPAVFGEWNVTRHMFHIVYYEREGVLPHMRHWKDGKLDLTQTFKSYDENTVWPNENHELADLLQEFQQLRAQQIALLPTFTDTDWLKIRPSGWEERNMHWIVAKTFQHTADHMNTILQMALFWR